MSSQIIRDVSNNVVRNVLTGHAAARSKDVDVTAPPCQNTGLIYGSQLLDTGVKAIGGIALYNGGSWIISKFPSAPSKHTPAGPAS